MQSLNVPSFFKAITIPSAYGLELILITFFLTSYPIVPKLSILMLLGFVWIACLPVGCLPVLMKCFTSIARPRFPSLLEKKFSVYVYVYD